MNPLRRLASSGPATPLCGTPRAGSPVEEPTGYGTMRRLSEEDVVGMRVSGERRDMRYGQHREAGRHEEESNCDSASAKGGLGMSRSRVYALIAVCTLSVGSHFAMYQLGPLKSRLHRELGTSNAQFSLLIAAYNLNSTWTPLVAGLFVARFGTGWSSIATTSCILIGQIILLLGVLSSHLVVMTFGLWIFGLGVTPLAVVQETLVSRLSPSNHLGISLALGLVSGKLASFVSSLVSLPLAERYGDVTPFGISVLLCAMSFGANMARLKCGWGSEVGEGEVKEKRRFSWSGVTKLGDVFWVYILLNVFSGMIWAPFLHLSANIVKVRYGLTDGFAAAQAAILLSGALILYPVTGIITDRLSPSTPRTTFRLLLLSSLLTLGCYSFLVLPPSLTHTPMPGLILFTIGHGMSTLLLVILVPRFLPAQLVPLGLGLHKSMEMASSALSQTLAGVWLDRVRVDPGNNSVGAGESESGQGEDDGSENAQAVAGLIRAFWVINVLQFICVLVLWKFESVRRRDNASGGEGATGGMVLAAEQYERLPLNDLPPLDSDDEDDVYDDDGVVKGHPAHARGRGQFDGGGSAGGKMESKLTGYNDDNGSWGARRSSRSSRRLSGMSNFEETARDENDSASSRIGNGEYVDREDDGLGFAGPTSALARDETERKRSRGFLWLSVGWIGVVWAVFLVDAYVDLL